MLLFSTDIVLPVQNRIMLFSSSDEVLDLEWPLPEKEYISRCLDTKQKLFLLNRYDHFEIILITDPEKKGDALVESLRIAGYDIHELANRFKWEELVLDNRTREDRYAEALAEGLALSGYQFMKYFSKPDEKRHSLQRLGVLKGKPDMIRELSARIDSVTICRDLVNEPAAFLNAPQLGLEITRMCREVGLTVEVLDKIQIESLKMGGLLAVNRGSIDPPRFIIITWEPEKAVNSAPLVLIGKGIMFDTGGLSLKPTPASMDEMKSDMAGAAAVAGILYGIARLGLPVKVVGLIPATDNRPDGNAFAPGDVIRMHDGTSVEVMNCDAEGRLILADALSYAKKYQPGLVIDLATLTGSAQMTLGSEAAAMMGNAPDQVFSILEQAGFSVHERLVRFPLWEEYGKLLDSEIADVKNIGGRMAGAIAAGKFLERFTNYPWIHLDIAGTAYLISRESYRGIGGTGTGVRLLLEFIKKQYQL
ncbi:MAG: leucyl aminopeptidase [Bacteroidota bacterium]